MASTYYTPYEVPMKNLVESIEPGQWAVHRSFERSGTLRGTEKDPDLATRSRLSFHPGPKVHSSCPDDKSDAVVVLFRY